MNPNTSNKRGQNITKKEILNKFMAMNMQEGFQIMPNQLDWTQNELPTKDDSLSEGLKLVNIRRNSSHMQKNQKRNIEKFNNMKQKYIQNLTQDLNLKEDFRTNPKSVIRATNHKDLALNLNKNK